MPDELGQFSGNADITLKLNEKEIQIKVSKITFLMSYISFKNILSKIAS